MLSWWLYLSRCSLLRKLNILVSTKTLRYISLSIILHNSYVIMSAMASQITSLTIVYSTVYAGVDKPQSSASLAFVGEIHQWPVDSPHRRPVTQKMFPFDDVMILYNCDKNTSGGTRVKRWYHLLHVRMAICHVRQCSCRLVCAYFKSMLASC